MRFLLAFALAVCAFAGDVTGKWSGTAEVKGQDGEVKESPAFLTLKQAGKDVTGTAGESEEDQRAIKDGRFENDELTFIVEVENDNGEKRTYRARLKMVEDGKLEGEVTCEVDMTAKLRLTKLS